MTDRRIAIVFDEDYNPVGSYAYETEEETRHAEQYELARLENGEWAAYGIIVYRPCEHDDHNHACPHAEQLESVWGTVSAAGHDGEYDNPERIKNDFLRDTVQDLWDASSPPPSRHE